MESDDSTLYFAKKNHKEVRKELEQSPAIPFQSLQNNFMEINTYIQVISYYLEKLKLMHESMKMK